MFLKRESINKTFLFLLFISPALYVGVLPFIQIIFLFVSTLNLLFIFFKSSIDKRIIKWVYFLTLFMFVSVLTNINNYTLESLKNIIMLIMYAFFIMLMVTSFKTIDDAIEPYMIACLVLAIIAIFQQLGYAFNIPALYDYTNLGFHVNNFTYSEGFLRVNSLLAEPSHLGGVLIPYISIFYVRLFIINYKLNVSNKIACVIVLLAFIMTASLVAFFGLVVSILSLSLLLGGRGVRKLIAIFFSVVTVGLVVNSSSLIGEKIDGMTKLNDDEYMSSSSGLSAYAVYSNYLVAKRSFQESPIFGVGIFNHEKAYFRYIGKEVAMLNEKLNYKDAASLYIRICSEFGLYSILLIVCFLIKFFPNSKFAINDGFYMYSIFFISIFVLMFRNGNYLYIPFIYFVVMLLNYSKINSYAR